LRIMQPYNIPVSCLQQLCILFQLQHIHVKRLRATQQQPSLCRSIAPNTFKPTPLATSRAASAACSNSSCAITIVWSFETDDSCVCVALYPTAAMTCSAFTVHTVIEEKAWMSNCSQSLWVRMFCHTSCVRRAFTCCAQGGVEHVNCYDDSCLERAIMTMVTRAMP
jgi:hypothetical protein